MTLICRGKQRGHIRKDAVLKQTHDKDLCEKITPGQGCSMRTKKAISRRDFPTKRQEYKFPEVGVSGIF